MINEKKLHIFLISVIVVAVAGGGWLAWDQLNKPFHRGPLPRQSHNLKTFASAQDFTAYVDATAGLNPGAAGPFTTERKSLATDQAGMGAPAATMAPTGRVSTTNVQVTGIDEPDILKTDGTNFFLSSETQFFYNFDKILPPPDKAPTDGPNSSSSGSAPSSSGMIKPEPIQSTTKVIRAWPAESLSSLTSIDTSGKLLLSDKALVIFSDQQILGYNVADPSKPTKTWTAKFGETESLVDARLLAGKIYLVTQTFIQRNSPCPLMPLTVDGRAVSIPCTEIFHPVALAPVDTTYTAMIVDSQTGTVEKKISFVGTSSSTVVAMFPDNLYITYSVYADPVATEYDFLTSAAADLLPAATKTKIARLQTYDLSRQAKLVELQSILDTWRSSLSNDELTKVEKTLNDRRLAYQHRHLRELETTNVVRVDLTSFQVTATGSVPGRVLNQFAIDEHQGFLRLATTSDGNFFGGPESVNDVYTLSSNLQPRGHLTDLGKGERIYGVRFVGNAGYVVTYKQTDPFFVLDLSNPDQPQQVGELKLPGYSSYLHPITATLVLGIGQQDFKTKLSLFDVSHPKQPVELSTLLLDDGWSDVQTNHHAFLLDTKHSVFFLPSGTKGEIVSYDQNKLTTVAAVTDLTASRAVYLNDVLYVVGTDGIKALDEKTWQAIKEISF